MRWKCAWHLRNFGVELPMKEIEPLENKSITDGMCPECEALAKQEIRDFFKKEEV